MTTSRWLIAAFWSIMLIVGAMYLINDVLTPAPPPPPEKHWFPPPLPSAAGPSVDADIRVTGYAVDLKPGATSFTVHVTIKNLGKKKATGIQVRIQPYVGNRDTLPGQPGPDEMPRQVGGDPMANVTQWLSFADLDAGQTATQTVEFPTRTDGDPSGSASFKPVINFQTAK